MLRGGSFDNNRNNVRCAYRNDNNPDNRNNNIGFRVLSHGFHTNLSKVSWSEFCAGYGLRSANDCRCSQFLAEFYRRLPLPDGVVGLRGDRPGKYKRGLCPLRVRPDDRAGTDPPPMS